MYGHVSSAAILGMVVSLLMAVLFPIILLVYWQKNKKPRFLSFVIGAATFIIFALTLEQLWHTGVMMAIGKGDMMAGNSKLSSNVWIYGLYGGLCAAVFEEVGRFLAMKYCMKNYLNKNNAIMYGIGHGGIEAIIILGLAEISNIATSFAINSGAIDTIISSVPEEGRDTVFEQISALWQTPAASFYLGGVERVIAVTLHICLSYMVYRFVKYNEKKYFGVALGIHFIVDFATVVLAKYVSLVAVEVVLALIVIVFLFFVTRMFKVEVDKD